MTKRKNVLLVIFSIILLSGCSDSQTKSSQNAPAKESLKIVEVQTPTKKAQIKKDYSIAEIYDSMCIQCHSSDGSGNTEKLTPSMTHLSEKEMITELKEVEADQGHIIMEHNRGEILKMGMEYQAEDMAKYMFQKFNQ